MARRGCSADESIPDSPDAPPAPHPGAAAAGAETHLVPSQLVWPLFVCHGEGVRQEVATLPGVYQTSVDELVKDAERAQRLGLGGIILFGLPAAKDGTGSEAYDEQGIVQQAARAVKRATPDLLVIGDACLCEYTDHGHCGVVHDG